MAKLTLTTDAGDVLLTYDLDLDLLADARDLSDFLADLRNALCQHEGRKLTPTVEPYTIRSKLDSYATPDGIRTLRKARGMTQAQLGERVRVRANTIARWERGERKPAGSTRDRLLDWIKDGGR